MIYLICSKAQNITTILFVIWNIIQQVLALFCLFLKKTKQVNAFQMPLNTYIIISFKDCLLWFKVLWKNCSLAFQEITLFLDNLQKNVYPNTKSTQIELFCLLPAKELYEHFFFLIRKQEKLDEKSSKTKEENNSYSEIWNLCSVDLKAIRIDFNVVSFTVIWWGWTLSAWLSGVITVRELNSLVVQVVCHLPSHSVYI